MTAPLLRNGYITLTTGTCWLHETVTIRPSPHSGLNEARDDEGLLGAVIRRVVHVLGILHIFTCSTIFFCYSGIFCRTTTVSVLVTAAAAAAVPPAAADGGVGVVVAAAGVIRFVFRVDLLADEQLQK